MDYIKDLKDTRKNIIIWGASRTGKSTLANFLRKELNYNIVQLDRLVSAFEKGFPRLEIKHGGDDEQVARLMIPFLVGLLRELNDEASKKRRINYVIEGIYLDIDLFF